jgi:hypothetical protein
MAHVEERPSTELPIPEVTGWIRFAAIVLRALFIATLLAVTLRVSMPQNETIMTAYETPGDLIRLVLGLVVCLWLAVQLFNGAVDAEARRTWLYLGVVAIPFAWICLFYTW